jgi:ATP-dependent exoDNAse (exonuclease V) alpha subunit
MIVAGLPMPASRSGGDAWGILLAAPQVSAAWPRRLIEIIKEPRDRGLCPGKGPGADPWSRHRGKPRAELDELAHAYAVTIHRSQGSEYPAVVIPLTTSSWMMLQRNLLYTGVTRARKLIVLAGSHRALAQAVRTPGAGRRHTALTHRLQPAR